MPDVTAIELYVGLLHGSSPASMGPIREVSELQEYSRENYVLEYTMCPESSLVPSGICAAP
jgi:hypothetical protein